jgi:inner membrane protein
MVGVNSGNAALIKLLVVSLLVIILLIPLGLIGDLIYERESRRDSAIAEVNQVWGQSQLISGPVVTVPYRVIWKDEKEKIHTEIYKAHFLPDRFEVTGTIEPQTRSRGIFDVAVYRVNLAFKGTFPAIEFTDWKINQEDIIWEEASFSMGLTDMRGIRDTLSLKWNQQDIEFKPGVASTSLFENGLHLRLPGLNQPQTHTFSFEVSLNGSQQLMFVPVGKKTTVALNSTWTNPSFQGAFLPVQREISEKGFTASWEVSHLGRSFPQSWTTQENPNSANLSNSAFGMSLLIPVDFYKKSQRSIKYGILFILLTFMTFFLFEVFNPLRIHPMQYMMVGAALCLFYLLLISISEHLDFRIAYLVASISNIGLISLYTWRALQSTRRAVILGLVLSGLYVYLYILLHLQDYSLIFGSVGLFLILSTVMYITRNVDWYNIQLSSKST